MTKRRWLGIALIVLGIAVFLLMPLPSSMTVEFAPDTGRAEVSDFHAEVTPLTMVFGIVALVSVVAGVVVLMWRTPNAH